MGLFYLIIFQKVHVIIVFIILFLMKWMILFNSFESKYINIVFIYMKGFFSKGGHLVSGMDVNRR